MSSPQHLHALHAEQPSTRTLPPRTLCHSPSWRPYIITQPHSTFHIFHTTPKSTVFHPPDAFSWKVGAPLPSSTKKNTPYPDFFSRLTQSKEIGSPAHHEKAKVAVPGARCNRGLGGITCFPVSRRSVSDGHRRHGHYIISYEPIPLLAIATPGRGKTTSHMTNIFFLLLYFFLTFYWRPGNITWVIAQGAWWHKTRAHDRAGPFDDGMAFLGTGNGVLVCTNMCSI